MIVEFSVKNFRSIKDLQTLSFVASKLDSNNTKYPDVDKRNIVDIDDLRLLKTVGIYGANASGKSNVIRAFEYFSKAISDLPSPESRLSNVADPFIYQDNYLSQESFFQIIAIINNKKYRYGFTVKRNKSAENEKGSKEIITNEWLFGPKEKNQTNYFTRKGQKLENLNLPEQANIPEIPYQHSLFLTHAASFSKGVCETIRYHIAGFLVFNYSLGLDYYRFQSIRYLQDNSTKGDFLNLLSSFSLNYDDITIEKEDEPQKSLQVPRNKIYLSKKVIGFETSPRLNLQYTESEGTKKMFDLAGLLMAAFRSRVGGIIVLDELDSNFHPSLVIKLVQLFNNLEINKSNFQLLFTSHDTNLLSPAIMRRDQIYFAEKTIYEDTRLYSLSDLKGIRNDGDFAKQYLAGFYGALPVLENLVEKNKADEESLGIKG